MKDPIVFQSVTVQKENLQNAVPVASINSKERNRRDGNSSDQFLPTMSDIAAFAGTERTLKLSLRKTPILRLITATPELFLPYLRRVCSSQQVLFLSSFVC